MPPGGRLLVPGLYRRDAHGTGLARPRRVGRELDFRDFPDASRNAASEGHPCSVFRLALGKHRNSLAPVKEEE
jgi:hypothetical protein